MINGVLGKIDPEDLGQVLAHEHVTCADHSMRFNFGKRFFDFDRVVDLASRKFLEAKACGIKTVIDGTPVNLGRDINIIKAVAEKTGMNFIVSSGFYYQVEPWMGLRSEDYIYELLIEECLNGINGTDILPGIMKAGSGAAGFTDYHKLLLGATLRAAVEAKLPIFIHHEVESGCGPETAAFALKKGMDPKATVIGHCSDSHDADYLEELFRSGCYLGFDRFGYYPLDLKDLPIINPNTPEEAFAMVLHFIEKGYEKQILLSMDLGGYLAFWDSFEKEEKVFNERAETDFSYIHRHLVPYLKEHGVTDKTLDQIFIENPKNLLTALHK